MAGLLFFVRHIPGFLRDVSRLLDEKTPYTLNYSVKMRIFKVS